MSCRHGLILEIKKAWGEIHRACQSTGERKYHFMIGRIATILTPCIILLSSHILCSYQIWVRASQSSWHSAFMVYYHQMVFGSRLDNFTIMTDTILGVLSLLAIKHHVYVTGLDTVNTKTLIECKSLVKLVLIICSRATSRFYDPLSVARVRRIFETTKLFAIFYHGI